MSGWLRHTRLATQSVGDMVRVSCDCGAKKKAVTGCAIENHGSEDLNPQLYMMFDIAAALILPVIYLTVFGVSDLRIILGLTGSNTM